MSLSNFLGFRFYTLIVWSVCLILSSVSEAQPNKQITSPRRKVAVTGMGKLGVQEDIGPYRFWKAKIKKPMQRWSDAREGQQLQVEYRNADNQEVNVTIVKYAQPEWLAHDLQGELLLGGDGRFQSTLKDHDGHQIYFVAHKIEDDVGAVWLSGRSTVVRIGSETKSFPDEIVSAYLRRLPSGLDSAKVSASYEDWCRDEISRRVECLEGLDWKKLKEGSVGSPEFAEWKKAVDVVARLTLPERDDESFFTWFGERFASIEEIKKRNQGDTTRDLRELRKKWDERKVDYKVGGRKHLGRLKRRVSSAKARQEGESPRAQKPLETEK